MHVVLVQRGSRDARDRKKRESGEYRALKQSLMRKSLLFIECRKTRDGLEHRPGAEKKVLRILEGAYEGARRPEGCARARRAFKSNTSDEHKSRSYRR